MPTPRCTPLPAGSGTPQRQVTTLGMRHGRIARIRPCRFSAPGHGTARMADQLQIRRFCVRWHTIVIAARARSWDPAV